MTYCTVARHTALQNKAIKLFSKQGLAENQALFFY